MATNGFTSAASGITTLGNDFTVVAPSSGSSWLAAVGSSPQSGQLYFEYVPVYLSGANVSSGFGIAVAGLSLTTFPGLTSKSVCLNNQNGSQVYYNSVQFDQMVGDWGENIGSPNFFGIAVDTGTGRLKVYKSSAGLWFGTGASSSASFSGVTGVDISALCAQGDVQPVIPCQSTTYQGANLGNWPPLIPGGMPSGYSMWNTGVGNTYTAGINAFNPSELTSQGALQSGQNNLRFYVTSGVSNTFQLCLGNLPIPLGRAYWEHRIETSNLTVSAPCQLGVRRTGFGLDNTSIDSGTNVGAEYTAAGAININGANVGTQTQFGYPGDVVQVALDLRPSVRKIWFGLNGVFSGTPGVSGGYSVAGLISAGSLYPAAGLNGSHQACVAANFGGYTSAFTPPTGFPLLDAAVAETAAPRARIYSS